MRRRLVTPGPPLDDTASNRTRGKSNAQRAVSATVWIPYDLKCGSWLDTHITKFKEFRCDGVPYEFTICVSQTLVSDVRA